MEKWRLFVLLICSFIIDPVCCAQNTFRVSEPKLELKDQMIHISYDILNSDPAEKFFISLTIKDDQGNEINAKALDGDVGVVQGGKNKHITWDPSADQVFLNSSIFIKVNARPYLPAEETEIPAEETEIPAEETAAAPEETKAVAEETAAAPEEKEIPAEETETKNYYRGGIILRSLALPGLGLSRISGNARWILGVTGYGCIAGSVILNRRAWNNYEKIDELVTYDDKYNLYQESLMQYHVSTTLASVAGGIWIIDFIWTLIDASDLPRKPRVGKMSSLSVDSSVDPVTLTPMVCLRYSF